MLYCLPLDIHKGDVDLGEFDSSSNLDSTTS